MTMGYNKTYDYTTKDEIDFIKNLGKKKFTTTVSSERIKLLENYKKMIDIRKWPNTVDINVIKGVIEEEIKKESKE